MSKFDAAIVAYADGETDVVTAQSPLASRLALARALVPEMVELLKELADDLEAETENRFGFLGETSPYHSENIRKRRDLEPVYRARAMLTAAEEPPHGP